MKFDHTKDSPTEAVGMSTANAVDKLNEFLALDKEGKRFSEVIEGLYNSKLTREELIIMLTVLEHELLGVRLERDNSDYAISEAIKDGKLKASELACMCPDCQEAEAEEFIRNGEGGQA